MENKENTKNLSEWNFEFNRIALEMAIQDFEKFCLYAGVNYNQLKICIEREKGLSLQQIANKNNLSKSTVFDITKKCFRKRN